MENISVYLGGHLYFLFLPITSYDFFFFLVKLRHRYFTDFDTFLAIWNNILFSPCILPDSDVLGVA